MRTQRTIGTIAVAVYIGAIVLANWAITHIGLVGVGFGLLAPAGVYFAGLTFPMRDVVQRSLGRWVSILAIIVGAGLSWLTSSPDVAVASGVTFLISESCDMAVYTPLQKRWFVGGVLASGVVAAVVDSLIFLHLAHIPYSSALAGTIVGKLWIVALIGGPLAYVLRRALPFRTPVAA